MAAAPLASARAAATAFFGLLACNAVIGNEDRVLRAERVDAGTGTDAAAPDASACRADLAGDPKNCGACGRDCLGSRCVGGRCEPAVLVRTVEPEQVVVVGDTMYFTHKEPTGAGVSWCPVESCSAPKTFFEDTGQYGLAADADGVVVVSPAAGLVYAYPPRYAGTGQLLLTSVSAPIAVALDGPNVFFTTQSGALFRCGRLKCGGQHALVAQGVAPGGALAVGETQAIWAAVRGADAGVDDGVLQQAPKDGVKVIPKTGSNGRSARTLHMSGTSLLWTATGGANDGEVSLRPRGLDEPETVCLAKLGDPWGVVADAENVYVSLPSAGEIRRFPRTACGAGGGETIATGQVRPHGLSLDARYVYWTSLDGAISRAAK